MKLDLTVAWFAGVSGKVRAGLGAAPRTDTARASARTGTEASARPRLAEAQALGARLPALLVEADQVASTVAQGVHGRRRAGMGDSFWQYRQALPGEPASRIDWRQSARSSRAFVRETEWEAAQSLYLWQDFSPSMHWRSASNLPLKSTRAELLLLATASLLLRGGEHVGLLSAEDSVDGGRGGASLVSGQAGLSRLALQLAAAATNTASLPPALELPRHARLVLIGDLLADPDAIETVFTRLSAIPVGCTLLQVLDPAELSLPYSGRVRFEGLEGEGPITTHRAQDLTDAYQEAMRAHQETLGTLCSRAGFGLIRHRTDEPPQTALLALHDALSHGSSSRGSNSRGSNSWGSNSWGSSRWGSSRWGYGSQGGGDQGGNP